MPTLIRTPEDVLRATGRDMYLIRFPNGARANQAGRDPDGHADLMAWFSTHQPHVKPELIGPSEFSGWIYGGITGDLCLNWTEADAAAFSAVWEDANGSSLDPRFQSYFYPLSLYEQLVAEHGDPRSREY